MLHVMIQLQNHSIQCPKAKQLLMKKTFRKGKKISTATFKNWK